MENFTSIKSTVFLTDDVFNSFCDYGSINGIQAHILGLSLRNDVYDNKGWKRNVMYKFISEDELQLLKKYRGKVSSFDGQSVNADLVRIGLKPMEGLNNRRNVENISQPTLFD